VLHANLVFFKKKTGLSPLGAGPRGHVGLRRKRYRYVLFFFFCSLPIEDPVLPCGVRVSNYFESITRRVVTFSRVLPFFSLVEALASFLRHFLSIMITGTFFSKKNTGMFLGLRVTSDDSHVLIDVSNQETSEVFKSLFPKQQTHCHGMLNIDDRN
jgi:hypothetical protein